MPLHCKRGKKFPGGTVRCVQQEARKSSDGGIGNQEQ